MLVNKAKDIKEVKEFKAEDEKLTKLMDKEYPLVSELGDYCRNTTELAFYMNAKYNDKKGK